MRTVHQYLLPALLLAVLLAGCGFHLRGALNLSDEIAPVYLQAGSMQALGREIKSLLQSNRIAMSGSESGANTVLVLLSESRRNRVLSVDSNGRAREYLLSYTASFSVQIGQGKPRDDSIEVSRSLLFDDNAVLAFANEADMVYSELRRDAARRILLKLQAYSTGRDKNKAR